MSFIEVVDQVIELLRDRERISYRVLKREFDLNDEDIEDLKEEIIGAKRVAADEAGRFLVWTGDQETASTPSIIPSKQPSASHP